LGEIVRDKIYHRLRRRRCKTETMKQFSIDSPEFKLCVLLSQANHFLSRVQARELREIGTSRMEYSVLYALDNIGVSATPNSISQLIGRTPHSTSMLLTRMEKGGLVTRNRDMNDKTRVRIVTTAKGQKIYELAQRTHAVYKLISAIPRENRRQLASNLEALRDAALKELGVRTKPPLSSKRSRKNAVKSTKHLV